jgi:hypothetical protein
MGQAVVKITPELFLMMQPQPGCTIEVVETDIPDDAKFLGLSFDDQRDVCFMLESDKIPERGPCQRMPKLRGPVLQLHDHIADTPIIAEKKVMPTCGDCDSEITGKSEPPDGRQLEDGRTVCGKCAAVDLKSSEAGIAKMRPGWKFAKMLHWLFHSWVLERTMGAHDYWTCKICGQRDVSDIDGIFGPVDWQWVLQGVWRDDRNYRTRPTRDWR